MSKYIKLEDAIKIIRNEIDEVEIRDSHSFTFRAGLRLAKNRLSDLPTIEIVRCEDCKFCEKHEDYSPTPIEPPWCYCKNPWVMRETGFNDFCSYGERIESEE